MSCGAKILLKDRYRALKLLGQGGFGKTFKAVDEDQPRKPLCVIKQFAFSNNHPETRQIALKLFYEEAQHLEALGKHDQIPELLAYFDVEGQPYLVQQFIDGQDLEQELAAAGTFNQAKIRELLESLLPVLDFLHHQSPPVIHRDIKPANIIRRRSDAGLVLVDFGAAKQATQSMLAKPGTVIGDPRYISPEQNRGRPAFASDIYSLGVTCIHLLTQVCPFDLFDTDRDSWVWRDYLVDNSVNEELGKVLDKMIANFLSQRYHSVERVLADLGHQQNTSSIQQYLAAQQKPIQILLAKGELPKSSDISIEMNYVDAGILKVNKKGNDAIIFNLFGRDLENYSQVLLKAFCISKYPITQRQYQFIMGKKLFKFKKDGLPVYVSWHDAMKFCQRLSIAMNKQYTLPSVSQWEYACFGEMIPSNLDSFILNRISYNKGNEWCLDENFHEQDRPSDGSSTIGNKDSYIRNTSIGLSRDGIRTRLFHDPYQLFKKASFRVVFYDYS